MTLAFTSDAEAAEFVAQQWEAAKRKQQAAEREERAYAKVAAAKRKRDAQSYNEYRKLDQQRYEQMRRKIAAANLSLAEERFAACRECADECQAEAEKLGERFTAAEEHARQAEDYARDKRAECERVNSLELPVPGFADMVRGGHPEDAARALRDANEAREVATARREPLDSLRAELDEAEAVLAEALRDLSAAQQELDRMREIAAMPIGTAPISDATYNACAQFMQTGEIWDTLSPDERFRVRNAIKPRDTMALAGLAPMLGKYK